MEKLITPLSLVVALGFTACGSDQKHPEEPEAEMGGSTEELEDTAKETTETAEEVADDLADQTEGEAEEAYEEAEEGAEEAREALD